MLAEDSTFERLKMRIEAGEQPITDWYRAIEQRAEALLDRDPVAYEIPDGKRLLRVSREAVARVYPLALTYRISGDRRFLERLDRELAAITAFPDWNPSHFLDTAEMAHAVGIALDWLHDDWSPSQRTRIVEALDRFAFAPALRVYREETRSMRWHRAEHNWNQVCNGGLTIAALAAADERPETAGAILSYAVASLPRAMREYAPDGGYKESPGYWSYGTFYNGLMLAALETGLGTDFGLAEHPGFDVTGDFPIQVTGPTGANFNFGDGKEAPVSRLSVLWWLGARFERPDYFAVARKAAERFPRALDLIWFRPTPSGNDTLSPRPLGNSWVGPHVVAIRGSWTDPQTTFVAFKGGRPLDNHAQCDIGTFVLEARGVRWAIDLGRDDYNLPGYFNRGKGRWRFYRNRAESHNTLLIDPDSGQDQDPNAVATIVASDLNGDDGDPLWAIVDMSQAYGDRTRSVRRGVKLFDGKNVLIQDEVDANDITLHWNMHTRATISLTEDARRAMLSEAGETLQVILVEPSEARFEVRSAQPLPNSPRVPGQDANQGVRKLTIVLEGQSDPRVTVFFVVDDADAPTIAPLERWQDMP